MAGGRFSVKAIFRAVDRFSVPVSRMSRSVASFSKKARRGIRSVDAANMKMMRGMGRAGSVMAAGAAVGAAAIVKTGSDFEQAITNVGAVSLKSRDQIQALETQALSLGATTKFTGTEVADGMEIMARAGFSTSEIMGGIPGILNAAAASGLELAEVSNHVSNVLKGMGLETTEAGRVADVLALASSRTNSTIGTLGESMKNVSSTARQLGIPLESVVASVALLQDVGLDASVAGSALNTMLTKLADPPKEIASQMNKLGLSFKKSNGDMKDFDEILATISTIAKDAGGNLDQVGILAKLVGLRGQKAATNLAKLFESGKVKTLTAELKRAKGVAREMAELRMDTVQGQWTLFKSAVDGVATSLFNMKSDALKSFMKKITRAINGRALQLAVQDFEKALPTIKKWFERIADGVKVFLAFTIAVKATGAAIAAIEGIAFVAGLAVEAYTFVVVTHSAKTKIAAAAQKLWNGMIWLGIAANKPGILTTIASTAVTWFNVAATKAAALAKGAWALATGGVSGALAIMTGATGTASGAAVAFNVALAPLLATLLAVGAAAGAAFWAMSELNKLSDETGGLGITGLATGVVDQLSNDGKDLSWDSLQSAVLATVDGAMDDKANDRFSQKAMVAPGKARADEAMQAAMEMTNNVTGEITILDQTGQAAVTKQPKAGGKLKLQKSGAN